MPDITSRKEIEQLMHAFYAKAMTDELIGFYFTSIVPLQLDHHIPIITDFWEGILFGADKYQGNPMKIHEHIHHLAAFKDEHFNRWLLLFCNTTDELFEGENAARIKQRATSIATTMKIKLVYGGISKQTS